MTFEELGVSSPLCRAVEELGFDSPMPVQEKVIPHLLENEGDVVALAQTGTGKTAAFGLPVIQRVDLSRDVPQALVLSPTRELCLQIASDLADFSKYIPELKVIPVYGGSSIESQIRAVRKGVQIVVATPGRLIDLINRGVVSLADVHTVVLDEADEMLNMGFLDSLNAILEHVPDNRKMLMFSATMPPEISKISKRYMHDPVEIVIGSRNEGAENVRHIYYMVNARDKYLALKRVVDNSPDIYAIVFCRTRRDTQEIAENLIRDGYNAEALHGYLSQQQRDIVMKKFRDRVTRILVATDVAARGLDDRIPRHRPIVRPRLVTADHRRRLVAQGVEHAEIAVHAAHGHAIVARASQRQRLRILAEPHLAESVLVEEPVVAARMVVALDLESQYAEIGRVAAYLLEAHHAALAVRDRVVVGVGHLGARKLLSTTSTSSTSYPSGMFIRCLICKYIVSAATSIATVMAFCTAMNILLYSSLVRLRNDPFTTSTGLKREMEIAGTMPDATPTAATNSAQPAAYAGVNSLKRVKS